MYIYMTRQTSRQAHIHTIHLSLSLYLYFFFNTCEGSSDQTDRSFHPRPHCLSVRLPVCMYASMCVYVCLMYVCVMFVCMHVLCICLCGCIHVYVCMRVYVCVLCMSHVYIVLRCMSFVYMSYVCMSQKYFTKTENTFQK